MARRPKEGQEVHDRKVAEVASQLRSRGYRVRADLPGHQRPPTIRGHIPDILAEKRSRRLIREIETRGTMEKDKAQHKAFKGYAERKRANFRVLMAKKRR